MMSQIPINLAKADKEEVDREILRTGIIAELDAVNLYKQMAEVAQSDKIKAMLHDIAREEKTHIGEFQAMLLRLDEEQAVELKKGKEEVDELME
jgi:rubrerythrin